jgi:hypothetical protein
MREPKEYAAEIETGASLPDGGGERFSGYGVIGLPFTSGHILALRRFAASSIGPAYTSVWHRSPGGDWTFFQDAEPQQACSRYFGSAIADVILQDISVEWTGPRSFTVRGDGGRSFAWQVTVGPTAATALMNAAGGLMPRSWWRAPSVLSLMGAAARLGLGTGTLRLAGHTPNGQAYTANPRRIWLVTGSRAVVDRRELGETGPLPEQGRPGDFLIPQRGIFATVSAFLESFDASRHLGAMTKSDAR